MLEINAVIKENVCIQATLNNSLTVAANIISAGPKGEKGDNGAGLNIIDVLNDTSELPATGNIGDAYLIDGHLWIWSESLNDWVNGGLLNITANNVHYNNSDSELTAENVQAAIDEVEEQIEKLITIAAEYPAETYPNQIFYKIV